MQWVAAVVNDGEQFRERSPESENRAERRVSVGEKRERKRMYLASRSRDRAASRPHQQALTISSHTCWDPGSHTQEHQLGLEPSLHKKVKLAAAGFKMKVEIHRRVSAALQGSDRPSHPLSLLPTPSPEGGCCSWWGWFSLNSAAARSCWSSSLSIMEVIPRTRSSRALKATDMA